VQLEDLLGEIEQVNLPGTVDEHPNWRRKLRLTLEEILADPAIRRLAQAIEDGRRAAAGGDV
jgi:4-alpha-glucanotransferase